MRQRTAPHPAQLLAIDEAAERLAVCRRTIERLIQAGTLPVVRLGRRRLVEERELARLIAAHRTAGGTK